MSADVRFVLADGCFCAVLAIFACICILSDETRERESSWN